MQRRSSGRRARRFLWIAGGVAALAVGATLIAADGAPPSRSPGAGLLPGEVPRAEAPAMPAAPPNTAGGLAMPQATETVPGSRRAEIVAEEARIAHLRETRAALERELVALRQEVAQRQREAGRKIIPDNLATGSPGTVQPAAGPAALPPTAPAATAAATPAAAPAGGLRVFVHHRGNSATAAAAAEEVAQNLRGAGFEVGAPRPVQFVPSTPVVRYFHEEDQAAAARLAGRLGRGWAIQDFRAFVPQPPPQTLEVWMPGQ